MAKLKNLHKDHAGQPDHIPQSLSCFSNHRPTSLGMIGSEKSTSQIAAKPNFTVQSYTQIRS